MALDNVLVRYVARQQTERGEMGVVVDISQKPIFEDAKSMDLAFFFDCREPTTPETGVKLGSSTISYASVKADEYRQRIRVTVVMPGTRIGGQHYISARQAAKHALPEIIAAYERAQTATRLG